ncbi:MAG: hypothetical protein HY831_00310 [Candidatus Aenigmarchaeota archaeon]|nr:hypothetical protein [Candidatus Aenigmarchaeota archaeon]
MKIGDFGKFLFIIGIILAIISGIFTGALGLSMSNLTSVSWISWMLVILVAIGLIVGLTSISAEKIIPFLIAAIALIVVSGTAFDPINNIFPRIGTMLENVIDLIAILIAPIAAVLSIKAIYALASKK